VTYTATYSDGSSKTLSYSDIKWNYFEFERGEAPTDDEQAEVRYCNLTSSGFITSNAEPGSLLNLAGSLSGSSYCVFVYVTYTEGGKTVGGYLDMTINVEAIGMEVNATGTVLYGSKPTQQISFYPKFKLRTGDGTTVYFSGTGEAKELVEGYGEYGFNLRGSDVTSWVISVDDCLSADLTLREQIGLYVRYPGLTIASKTITWEPNL